MESFVLFSEVFCTISVHDEALLERSAAPLPLLSALSTRAHWDVPVPGQTWPLDGFPFWDLT